AERRPRCALPALSQSWVSLPAMQSVARLPRAARRPVTGSCRNGSSSRRTASSLEPHLFEGPRIGKRLEERKPRFLHPRSDASDERVLPERRVKHAVVQDLLDLIEDLLSFLPIELPGLTLEEILVLRKHNGRVETVLRSEALDPRGG